MRIGMRTVKRSSVYLLPCWLPTTLSLLFWPSAGIIALLSVGNTLRSTLMTGIYRIAAFIICHTDCLFVLLLFLAIESSVSVSFYYFLFQSPCGSN